MPVESFTVPQCRKLLLGKITSLVEILESGDNYTEGANSNCDEGCFNCKIRNGEAVEREVDTSLAAVDIAWKHKLKRK